MERTLCLVFLVAAAQLAPADGAPRYLNSRQVLLSFSSQQPEDVRVHLWVSRDSGRTWESAPFEQQSATLIRFETDQDARYDFYMVLENAAGRSAPDPSPGTEPHTSIVIDTLPPLLQVHPDRPISVNSPAEVVNLPVTLIEEHLNEQGVRIFYRTAGMTEGPFFDGGPARFANGRLAWSPPADISPRIDVRVVATDLAGNRAAESLADISLPARGAPVSELPPATSAPAPTNVPTSMPAAPSADSLASHRVRVEPVAPISPDEIGTAVADARRAGELRSLATRYMEQGRFPLAIARLEDALHLQPSDNEAIVQLGNALYGENRYDEASARFQSVLSQSPDHLGALEGLALVAATQRQYPVARDYLKKLVQLKPQSGVLWLRYGDVEHRMGNTRAAASAWERALSAPLPDEDTRRKAQRRLDMFRERAPTTSAATVR